jgi:hypothetical protein
MNASLGICFALRISGFAVCFFMDFYVFIIGGQVCCYSFCGQKGSFFFATRIFSEFILRKYTQN